MVASAFIGQLLEETSDDDNIYLHRSTRKHSYIFLGFTIFFSPISTPKCYHQARICSWVDSELACKRQYEAITFRAAVELSSNSVASGLSVAEPVKRVSAARSSLHSRKYNGRDLVSATG